LTAHGFKQFIVSRIFSLEQPTFSRAPRFVSKGRLNMEMQKMANEQRGGSGNFANDPQRASEEGRKGAEQRNQQNQQGGSQGQQGGEQGKGGQQSQQGNPGNFANDREKASEAGRKGGQS
jgi:uncharacterized protein